MKITFEFLPTLVFAIVMICWFAFGGIFIFRRKPEAPPDQKRDRGSIIGVAVQGLSYAIVWGVRREAFTPIVSGSEAVELTAGIVAVLAAIGSVVLIMCAVKTLGKEWSLTARLVEGHKLATSGPYAYVRHPIYTGMLGMLLATGLAISHWLAVLAALLVFIIGTVIRVRSEEKLLREAFGQEFDNYSQRVPAIVPGLF
jgi:protein-S-isoprenylcysteine O-methyltransferase Ste14